MSHRPFASVSRSLIHWLGAQSPPSASDPARTAHRLDRLGRSLAATATATRRGAVRLSTSAALAAVTGWQLTGEADAHNPLKKCKKLKERAERKRCIKKAKAHNAKHKKPKKRKPNASCPQPAVLDTHISISNGRFAQTFTEPNGGKLRAASLAFRRYSAQSGAFNLSVNAVDPATGYPTNVIIATAIPLSADDVNAGIFTFQFPYPATLIKNRQYALVLSRANDDNFAAFYREPRSCPGGAFFYSPSISGSWSLPTVLAATMFYKTFVSSR